MQKSFNFFILLLIPNIIICMNEPRVETIQRTVEVGNLKVKSKFISQGISDDISKEHDNNTRHILDFFLAGEYLNIHNTGTLSITETFPGVAIATDIPPRHCIRWNHYYGIQKNESQKIFNCSYVTPNTNDEVTQR